MPYIRCKCTLRDCAYFNAVPGNTVDTDCAHPDKEHYMTNPCPLYRKDLSKALEGEKAAEIKARFLKKRL